MCWGLCKSRHRMVFPLWPLQLCEVLNATEMTCQAPALALGPDHQSDLTERPEEFGFILDNVQSLLILNKTNFTYYPNPVFEAFGPSGILELKPGTPIILKVDGGHGQVVGSQEAAVGDGFSSRRERPEVMGSSPISSLESLAVVVL